MSVTVVVSACGGHHSAAQPPSGTNSSVVASPIVSSVERDTDAGSARRPAALKTYGYGANPTGADYQPGVVVVGGGAAAIRSASGNGLVWTIAKDAPGADKLRSGR